MVAVLATVTIMDRCHQSNVSEWESRVEKVQREAAEQRVRAEEALEDADQQAERADSIAEEAQNRAPEIRERIVEVEAETPDSLRDHPAIVQRDSIITDLRNESRQWRTAYEQQKQATARLRTALTASMARGDSLSAVLDDRPGERAWWLPEVGFGGFVGVCTDTRPCSGVGATLSWKVTI